MDKLTYMRVFVYTVKFGSMAQAAKELNVSPPMISKTISRLEEELGVQLIVRTTRKRYLTDAGKIYFERCEKILRDIDETHLELRDKEKSEEGTIKISLPVSLGRHVIFNFISKFQALYKDIAFHISCGDEELDLVDGRYDLAIRVARHLQDSSVRARVLAQSQMQCCASPAYLEQHGRPQTLAELSEHNCLTSPGYDSSGEKWSAVHNSQHESVLVSGSVVVDSGDFAAQLALNHRGVVCQPRYIVSKFIQSGELQPVLPDYQWAALNVYLIYPNARHTSSKVRRFINFLAEEFEREGWEG